VCRGGLEVGVAKAPKHSKMIILWWLAVEPSERYFIINGGGGAHVKQIACDGLGFSPI
jgi:hypothetical protein